MAKDEHPNEPAEDARHLIRSPQMANDPYDQKLKTCGECHWGVCLKATASHLDTECHGFGPTGDPWPKVSSRGKGCPNWKAKRN